MNANTAFTIYNAAAGAGKTYTLVKAYLITLLEAEFKDSYKNILAITFTNKAVAEMKTRVIENLVFICASNTPLKYQDILDELIEETKIPEAKLKLKARRILNAVLHNYAAFDIVTIDTLTHRVIRTFAHDLGIPVNFEIEMDTEVLIQEAVDAVVAKIGLDEELTNLIIDFAISKLEEDKSWDVTIELNKVAKLLFSENDREQINKLSDRSIKDFKQLHLTISQKITQNKITIMSRSKAILELIDNKGLDDSDFKGGYITKHFKKLTTGESKIDFSRAKWMQEIETTAFYNKTLEDHKKDIIEDIRPSIEEAFLSTKKELIQIQFFQNIIKNLTPLSILNAINKELIDIKKERRILLISEFNTIISNAIQDQPAPFIYERLGERYRDYFIDEFQDTSELQWKNLVPLIDNAIATETLTGKRGKLTIVGDAKQAIYRWRGGKAEQFINLSLDHNPFSVKQKEVLNLPRNYRSHEEIVQFNNDLFTFLANDFSNQKHQELYRLGNKQEVNSKKDGYVNISFITAKNVAEEHEIYPHKVYEYIIALTEKGYLLNEICILVRKQKEGAVIADFLSEKGLSIISSETLLINKAPEVVFIIDLITWYAQPNNLLAKTNMLHFLVDQFSISEQHSFLQKMIFADQKTFSLELKNFDIDFNLNLLATKPLYDAVEYIVSSFKLANQAPAYIQFFLDEIFGYTQKHTGGILGFLSYWETKKDKLSIVAPSAEGAIQIITIHKAKGLEFPCVIYPYANIDLYEEIEPKTWLPVNKESFNGFDEVFVNYSKAISDYGKEANDIVLKRQAQLELDKFNLLYVALTRAVEQLYVISKLELTSKGAVNPNKFSGKLINYLEHIGHWNPEKLEYTFGKDLKPEIIRSDTSTRNNVIQLKQFDDSSRRYNIHIITNSGRLWDTTQKDAIEKGNIMHNLMASIYTHEDVHTVIEEAYNKGEITSSEKNILLNDIIKLVEHPKLSQYFSVENTVYNERDIIVNGKLIRPDRIVISKDNRTTIIDYKTGSSSTSHTAQIEQYARVLKDMGHQVENKILLYFNDKITLNYV
ncbi:UvrD-helicase domain-containing protein [Aquimarina mytili]|uniref:DNA 3'-5' helicase n=1 Tax=Aquimarina mytili TaxID=874423 RepID=A0A937D9W4_9FLAO|nr:UvrD-helicase domain-containing protein [Aquimarina mytili]MBL0685435.1 UvrD-helicase domain-containing protein [Aquimarina mytili]